MGNAYSMDDLLDFLAHAGDRGLMPAATASALAVAVRNVLVVLTDNERNDLSQLDTVAIIKRFNNKRAREFSPSSLKEYGRRLQRAVDLFNKWRDDPANFSIKTRATKMANRDTKGAGTATDTRDSVATNVEMNATTTSGGGYSSSVPIRTDWVVTITNIPSDLTTAEAERLAKFMRMLAIE